MALGILMIIFIVMVVVSGLGIAFLYISKNERLKNGLFYFLALWAMGIAVMNATALPSNYIVQRMIAWGFGLLALVAIIIKTTNPGKGNLARLLVTASIVCSVAQLLF